MRSGQEIYINLIHTTDDLEETTNWARDAVRKWFHKLTLKKYYICDFCSSLHRFRNENLDFVINDVSIISRECLLRIEAILPSLLDDVFLDNLTKLESLEILDVH